VWRQADKYNVPRIAFVNKMDRVGADFDNVIQMMKDRLGAKPVPLNVPMFAGDMFTGTIDLVEMRAVTYEEGSQGVKLIDGDIPRDLLDNANAARFRLLEAVAEYDEQLLDDYLHEKPYTSEDLRRAIRKGTLAGIINPVLCGSAFKNKGVQKLLDAVVEFLPSPLDKPPIKGHHADSFEHIERSPKDNDPFSALAFKIMTDPYVGKLTFFRVYSGKCATGDTVLNPITGNKERIGRLVQMHANKREEITEVMAGDIAAGIGFKKVTTGHTLCSLDPDRARGHDVPRAGRGRGHRAKSSRREKMSVALQPWPKGSDVRVRTDEETAQTVISAWASCTSRSAWTA
jgi:elongation factor G